MDANNIKFRCSALGYLMTEPKTKSEKLSETTKTHCVDMWVREKYNRFTEINAKQLDKGNEVEEDSITTVSRKTKILFKKNEIAIENAFIKGTPDLFTGESIMTAKTIRDTKSSWDAYSFFRAKDKGLDKKYYWQGLGYAWITGALECSIDYCLNNTPYHIVEGELRKESYNHPGNDTPKWIELQIIANHTYDKETFEKYAEKRDLLGSMDFNAKAIVSGFVEIPLEERHFNYEFDRNEDDIELLEQRVVDCREYISKKIFNKSL